MIILPAKLSELTGSSKANSTGSSLANSSPGSTQTRQTSNKDTINHVQGSNNMMQWWYAMRDAMRDAKCKIWQGMHEPGLNLEIQVCHWKDEMKSLENDIKNAESELRFGNDKRFKNDTGLWFTASSHLNATKWTCYNTQTWQQNTWQESIHDA